MNDRENGVNLHKNMLLAAICGVLFLSVVVSSSYRGIAHDEGLSNFDAGARRILAHQPVFSDNSPGENKAPARFIYIALMALGYKLCGFNLVALHIFPYLFQIINPVLFLLVGYRWYKNVWWGFGGALLFIFQPFNLVYLNQPHNHPIFVFFLLSMVLLGELAHKNPKLLVIWGIIAALLLLTRFEDGVIFVAMLAIAYLAEQWNRGLPVRWIVFSCGAMLFTYWLFAVVFHFPLGYPVYYLPHLLKRQADYGTGFSFYELTIRAYRIWLYWYFCGKFSAPFLLLLSMIGAFVQLKRKRFYPLLIFLPHVLFLGLIFNGRWDVISLPAATFSVPGFILLLLSGIQTVSKYFSAQFFRKAQRELIFAGKISRVFFFQGIVSVVIMISLLGFFGKTVYFLSIVVEASQPASNMWRIVKSNPPLRGNPLYQEPFMQLSPEFRLPLILREYVYQRVLGNYRPWFLHEIGNYAFEHKFSEEASKRADFVYFDDYATKNKWETDRFQVEGPSPLWTEAYPGRIGAFPFGKSGAFVYKFQFPQPVEYVTLSDVHTQWDFGDVTKMWTSPDGDHWVLRYNNWNVTYTPDRYYQFFEHEFDGQRTLFVKYSFLAGDRTRAGNDNRGASLEKFSLVVEYKK